MSIAVTGTPGVGKHTVSDMLSEILGMQIVDINQVAKESGLLEPDCETSDVDTQKLESVLGRAIKNPSIIVGHLAPYVLNPEQVRFVVVLRRDPYELLATYRDRGYSDAKIRANCGSEILDIIYHDAKNKFGCKALQVVSAERDKTVQKVLDAMRKKKEDRADWLEQVRQNRDLEMFFQFFP